MVSYDASGFDDVDRVVRGRVLALPHPHPPAKPETRGLGLRTRNQRDPDQRQAQGQRPLRMILVCLCAHGAQTQQDHVFPSHHNHRHYQKQGGIKSIKPLAVGFK